MQQTEKRPFEEKKENLRRFLDQADTQYRLNNDKSVKLEFRIADLNAKIFKLQKKLDQANTNKELWFQEKTKFSKELERRSRT